MCGGALWCCTWARTAEFYAFFKQDRTPFGDRAFAIMDDDGSGQISFQEFVCALWNYLSFDLAALVRFSFSLYDQDSSGYLDVVRCPPPRFPSLPSSLQASPAALCCTCRGVTLPDLN